MDDLKSIDALEEYVDATAIILIFVSKGYFGSKSALSPMLPITWPAHHPRLLVSDCLREAVCTVNKRKRITLVHDSAVYRKSYAPLEEIKDELSSERAATELGKAQAGVDQGRLLSAAQLRAAIFQEDQPSPRSVIEWHRIKVHIAPL